MNMDVLNGSQQNVYDVKYDPGTIINNPITLHIVMHHWQSLLFQAYLSRDLFYSAVLC